MRAASPVSSELASRQSQRADRAHLVGADRPEFADRVALPPLLFQQQLAACVEETDSALQVDLGGDPALRDARGRPVAGDDRHGLRGRIARQQCPGPRPESAKGDARRRRPSAPCASIRNQSPL